MIKINKYINETIYSSQSFALLERVEEVLSGWDWDHCLNFFEMSQMLHFPSLNKACCMSGTHTRTVSITSLCNLMQPNSNLYNLVVDSLLISGLHIQTVYLHWWVS